jgi:SAM-dependent methyltransferase
MPDDDQQGALWSSADAYERYVGRWSRPVADELLRWLDAPPRGRWLDVGCGTGALSERVLASCTPAAVHGVDPSAAFLAAARGRLGERATFAVGTAEALPVRASTFDVVVSGLVLNFVPDPRAAVTEFRRVLRPGGMGAAYIWDYAGDMQMLRHFWDAAIALDPSARNLDEAVRCSICSPAALAELLRSAGFDPVEAQAIDVPTPFASFDDYWRPFLAGRAPAPAYAVGLSDERRGALRDELRRRLPIEDDGSIRLIARAWAVRGTMP